MTTFFQGRIQKSEKGGGGNCEYYQGKKSQFPTVGRQKDAGKHWWPVTYATSHKRPLVPSVGGTG